MDNPVDSPFTSESESEDIKTAAQKAQDKAAFDKKTVERKRRRQNWARNQAKQEAVDAVVFKAREAVLGLKKKPRVSPIHHRTDAKEPALTEAQQAANAKALRLIEQDEEIGNEDDGKIRLTFTNEKKKKTYVYNPAQPGHQDWDSAHDDCCAPVLGCCEWQGKQQQESNCKQKDTSSSSNSSLSN
jgi:hypothetical protein